LQLLTVERTFGTEELSSCSLHLNSLEPDPCLFIHREDAERLGLEDGDTVEVTAAGGSLSVKACITDSMRTGVLFLPRFERINWQQLGTAPIEIAPGQIRKV
jgi:anaerobic selenocysteine-containing dehydrogenase